MKLTKEQIEELSHIPSEEIEKDIKDTQMEIDQYEEELKILIKNRQENRLEIYLHEGKISKRKEFINKLEIILEYRNAYN